MKIEYPAIFQPEEGGGYFVSFPDFQEAFTEGDTLEEALANAVEVLDLTLISRIEDGEPIPLPPTVSEAENIHSIAPDPNIQAALLIRFGRGDTKIADIARSLHTSWPAVARLEDPKHWPNLRQLHKAAKALGKRLVLVME